MFFDSAKKKLLRVYLSEGGAAIQTKRRPVELSDQYLGGQILLPFVRHITQVWKDSLYLREGKNSCILCTALLHGICGLITVSELQNKVCLFWFVSSVVAHSVSLLYPLCWRAWFVHAGDH
jgi:hypothetical protein